MRLFLLLFIALFISAFASPIRAEEAESSSLMETELDAQDADADDLALVEIPAEENEFDAEAVGAEGETAAAHPSTEATAAPAAGAEFGSSESAWSPSTLLSRFTAPPKQRLATRNIDLGTEMESVQITQAPESKPLAEAPPSFAPRQVLAKQHAPRLGLMRLPIKASAAKEHRPVQMLAPLKPRQRAPQYHQKVTKQELIQPVVQIQPMLHQRVLTRTIYQPTMQKQPVIQRVITQPILRRVIREQPITQQQMHYQNIVQTRQVKQPQVREELKVERETQKQQVVETQGAPYPRLTQAPKKSHAEASESSA